MNRKAHYYGFSLLCLAILAGGMGCSSTTVNTAERDNALSTPTFVKDKRIVTDKRLGKIMKMIDVSETTVSGDLLKVQAVVMNNSKKTRSANYKFEWYDSHGMLLSSLTAHWKTVRIMGKEKVALSAVATDPDAVDFRLKMVERQD